LTQNWKYPSITWTVDTRTVIFTPIIRIYFSYVINMIWFGNIESNNIVKGITKNLVSIKILFKLYFTGKQNLNVDQCHFCFVIVTSVVTTYIFLVRPLSFIYTLRYKIILAILFFLWMGVRVGWFNLLSKGDSLVVHTRS